MTKCTAQKKLLGQYSVNGKVLGHRDKHIMSVLEKGAQPNGLGGQQAGWLLVDVAVMDTPGTVPCWMNGRYFMMGVNSLFSAGIFLSIAEQKCQQYSQ
jgi:hypothetical protein